MKPRIRLKKGKLPKKPAPRIEFDPRITDRDYISCDRFLPTARDKDRCHICLKPKSAHSHGEGIDE